MSLDIDKVILEIGDTINTLGCLEVEEAIRGNGYIAFKCLCTDDATWKELLTHFVLNAYGFRHHVCFRPFKVGRGDDRSLRWFWYVQFSADDMSSSSPQISNGLLRARVHAAKVTRDKPVSPRVLPAERTEMPVSAGQDPHRVRRWEQQEREEREAKGVGEEFTDDFFANVAAKPPEVNESDGGGVTIFKEVPLPWPNRVQQRHPDGRGARPITD